jgi:regulator of replication initiation timing
MSIVTPNVVKAHAFARQAEEALEDKRWDDAVNLHQQAAQLFLLATNDTQDSESIKALQLLSTAQSNKSRALLRQVQHFNAIRAQAEPILHFAPSETKIILEPMEETLSAPSENYSEGPSQRTKRSVKYTEKKPLSSDLWGWIETMLQILPDSNGGNRTTGPETNPLQNSTLMSSFYFVPSEEPENVPPVDLVSAQPISSPADGKELLERIRGLEDTVHKLTEENTKLKNKLQSLYAQGLAVTKENDYMKRSILHFKQEFKKKAHQLRDKDISSSVGDIQYYHASHYSPLSHHSLQQREEMQRTIDSLRQQLAQLTHQLRQATQPPLPQVHLLREPFGFMEEDRKQSYYSPPVLTNSPPLPSSLTNSLILDRMSLPDTSLPTLKHFQTQQEDPDNTAYETPSSLMSSQIIMQ